MATNNDDDAAAAMAAEPGQAYALSGRIMLSAIVILFAVVVFMVGLHLYARWYLVRLRRRQVERRRHRRGTRPPHVVLYADAALPADGGLDPAVLASLPVFLHAAAAEEELSPECAVCLSEFEEKEIVRLLPKCKHRFHIECIDMWFSSHSTCPLCRSAVEKVAAGAEPVVKPPEPVEELSLSEPGSSSATGVTTSFGRKGADFDESAIELTQSSPAASRLLSFKRILSMGKRPPAAAATTSPRAAGGADEVDLESGPSESSR